MIKKKFLSALMAGVFGGSLMFSGLAMAAGNGDADGDGEVDLFDAMAVLNYATGKNKNGIKNYNNADVNGDGLIDKADVEGIQNIIRTGRVFNQYSKTATQKTTAYKNYQLTEKVAANEYVAIGDNVTVLQEFENAYFVRYPISNNRTKDRWVAKSVFEESNNGGAISPSGYAYPLGHKTKFGNGHDCAIAEGTPVYAIADGEAKFYQVLGTYNGKYATVSYGNFIELHCNNGALAKYAHLSSFEGVGLQYASIKNPGSTYTACKNYGKKLMGTRRVSKGDLIGYVGTTGNSSGPHLHFELHENGSQRNINNYFNR